MKGTPWLLFPAAAVTVFALRTKIHERIPLESIPFRETTVISRVLHFIEKNYVDPQSTNPLRMLKEASQELERKIPPLLVDVKKNRLEIQLGEKRVDFTLSRPVHLNNLVPIFSQLLGFLEENYEGRPDTSERLSLMLGGAMEALDPHSNYFPPKVYAEFKIGTKGNFGGLGIVIGLREGALTVISPLEGTPAAGAGIKSKDKITQIGQESTINMGLTEAVEKLRGPIGSSVSIVISRTGLATPLNFTLTRALIHIQSVAGKMLDDKKTVLLKIKNFQEDTTDQFKKIIGSFEERGLQPEGLILDLRNNPGGLLDQAVAMADYFLEEGMIVKTVGAHGEVFETEKAEPGDGGEPLPVVVLVNEGSASASEIIAGALQQNDRAVVIGSRTFGKGSVQTVYDLKNGSALKLTIAKYLTAKNQEVQSIGINPDVGLTPATIDKDIFNLHEDVKKREFDLQETGDEDTLEEERADLPASPLQMTYFSAEKGEEEESTGKIELQNDFPVRLAARILRESGGKVQDRLQTLKSLPLILEALKKEEQAKIEQAMTRIGIDWSEGEKKGRPTGAVTLEITDEKGNPRSGLGAGESGFLRVTVENRGNAPFYRLLGVTKSEDPLFANLEFPFGKIDPQQKKTWKKTFKIPDFISRRHLPVALEFYEQFNRHPKSSPFPMEINEPPMPHFQYSYILADGGKHGTAGNGNRKAERGETVGLLFKVKNTGPGTSQAPVVNIKNLGGEEVFIEKGHAELAALPPQGEAPALLKIRIPSKGQTAKLNFDLTILDNHLGAELTDRLILPLDQSPLEPPAGAEQTAPVISFSEIPSLISEGQSYKLKGAAADDRQLKNIFIFVGDEKVFYKAASGDERNLDFETILPLKKGPNLVTVAAQDDRELTGQKQWIVWRNR